MYRLVAGFFAVTLILGAQTGSDAAGTATGADPSQAVASVSGAGAFSINGASLANGVPSWPLMAGDQIVTGASSAVITLPDGTELELSPRSKVTIVIRGGVVEVIVSSGDCHPKDPHGHNHHCWVLPEKTSNHRCGDGGGDGRDHDQDVDDRCCPDRH